jgi:hypothetical protein
MSKSRDYNQEFRQAANDGKLSTVKSLLQEKDENDNLRVDINGCGPSGNRALHNAAAKGHYLIVEYLVSQDADIDLKNNAKEPQTALDRASNPQTKMFLSMVKPLLEAIAFAKEMFPDPERPGCNDRNHVNFMAELKTLRGAKEVSMWNGLQKFLSKENFNLSTAQKESQQEMMSKHELYTGVLNMIGCWFEASKKTGFKEGLPGARCGAAFAYLFAKGYADYPVENLRMEHKYLEAGSHEMLVIGRDPQWNLTDLKSNKYTIFCDATRDGIFYSSYNIPSDTLVAEIMRPDSVHKGQVIAKPSGEGFLYGRAFFEDCWNKSYKELKNLVGINLKDKEPVVVSQDTKTSDEKKGFDSNNYKGRS